MPSRLPAIGRSVLSRAGLLVALVAAMGCGEQPPGSTCRASSECSTELCYANRCLDPLSDEDGDGVPNGTEYKLGSHPLLVDTDGDGKHDGAEVGPDASKPLDRDGDGRPDVIEALNADADRDCLVDELDPDDAVPNQDPLRLARDACGDSGVCKGQFGLIVATCDVGAGILNCDYNAVPGWSAGELCDGKDNDCDGQIDEGHTYQGAGIGGQCKGTGQCGLGLVECAAGKAVCSTNPGASDARVEPEQCNGVDDDCDGKTDEGFVLDALHVGAPCYGTGECGVGVVVCGGSGKPLCSSNPGGPAARDKAESCDGKDNDCDGLVDEDLTMDGLALGEHCVGLGACGKGIVVCGADAKPVCSTDAGAPASQAQPEVCNAVDDNCDGQTDEGFSYDGAVLGAACVGVGACGPGQAVCGKGGTATCSSMPDALGAVANIELCNGKDDDCDGLTDEDFVYQGRVLDQVCDGVGQCGAGIIECAVDGKVTCSTNPDGSSSEAGVETCNNLDDDCNGLLDDVSPSGKALECVGKGVCAGAKPSPVCVGGNWACDYPDVLGFQGSGETICDGKDNDCDGLTDEGLPHVWEFDGQGDSDGAPAARLGAASYATGTDLWLAGGLAGSLAGGLVGADGLWRLDLATKRWHLVMKQPALARDGATLAVLPKGFLSKEERIWLMGGEKAGASTDNTIVLDPVQDSSWLVAFANPPAYRMGAVAVVDPKSKRLYLVGGADDGSGPAVQVFAAPSSDWLPAAQVPQPGALIGPAAACLTASGDLWVYGHSGPDAPVFASLPAGATKWLSHTAGPAGQTPLIISHGRLICDPLPGKIWLVGGVPAGATQSAIYSYHLASKQWSKGAGAAYPGGRLPIVAASGAGELVVGMGHDAKGTPDHRIWSGKDGAWQVIAGGPEAVVGARLVGDAKQLWRIGGALMKGEQVSLEAFGWTRSNGDWQALPTLGQPHRSYANVLHDPTGKRLLVWGGSQSVDSASDLVSTVAEPPAAGGEVFDLSSQTWSAMPAAMLSGLPTLAVDAALAVGPKPNDAWAYGQAPKIATVQLWRLDLAPPVSKQLVWSQSGDMPAFRRGAALAWDPILERVVLFTIDGALQVWGWSPATGGKWQKLGQDNTIAQGRLRLFGDVTLIDPLLAVSFPVGGVATMFRKVKLSGVASLSPWTSGGGGGWWGPVESIWLPPSGEVLLSGGVDLAGRPLQGVGRWQRTCSPATP